ncbi:hypothetical protein BLNAU_20480 [Blattamonas nauphoetae]|uniref:Uncharacterized protein n=1 Tax=Blattamonas nauphoetae TaxID=2049346 RepID=A0ABQ9X1X5_9EUKA|nr:hypothetical protein BLNAU_20480 [Blattamonas nauphoetae]
MTTPIITNSPLANLSHDAAAVEYFALSIRRLPHFNISCQRSWKSDIEAESTPTLLENQNRKEAMASSLLCTVSLLHTPAAEDGTFHWLIHFIVGTRESETFKPIIRLTTMSFSVSSTSCTDRVSLCDSEEQEQ